MRGIGLDKKAGERNRPSSFTYKQDNIRNLEGRHQIVKEN